MHLKLFTFGDCRSSTSIQIDISLMIEQKLNEPKILLYCNRNMHLKKMRKQKILFYNQIIFAVDKLYIGHDRTVEFIFSVERALIISKVLLPVICYNIKLAVI